MLGWADRMLGLLPGHPGRHEHDLVEPEQGLDLGGGDEVTMVDGIEGPTHHAEALTCGAQWWLSDSSECSTGGAYL